MAFRLGPESAVKMSQTPTVANVSMPTANVEVSYALPKGTKRFLFKLRSTTVASQLAYVSGASGTTFVTVAAGASYTEEHLWAEAVTLYFQSGTATQTAEIVSWA
jgi:hypothetical protein